MNLATGTVTLVIGAIGGVAAPDTGIVGYSVAAVERSGPERSPALSVVSVVDSARRAWPWPASVRRSSAMPRSLLATSGVPLVVPDRHPVLRHGGGESGLDLTFLGMPGCFATNGNPVGVTFPVSFPAATGSDAADPEQPRPRRYVLSAQSIAFSLATPFNLVSSNGLQITIGF